MITIETTVPLSWLSLRAYLCKSIHMGWMGVLFSHSEFTILLSTYPGTHHRFRIAFRRSIHPISLVGSKAHLPYRRTRHIDHLTSPPEAVGKHQHHPLAKPKAVQYHLFLCVYDRAPDRALSITLSFCFTSCEYWVVVLGFNLH